MLPLIMEEDIILQKAHTFDGLLFAGGHDVNPAIHGEAANKHCGDICTDCDQMEILLFRHAAELDKPMLGICRGIQLFNAILGGTLYQDLSTGRSSIVIHKQKLPYSVPVHDIYTEKDSLLHQIVQTDVMQVNSYHHQGIIELSNQLEAVAIAEDGLIEAVVLPSKTFVLAVQWHPEFSYKNDDHNFKLFQESVNQAEAVPVTLQNMSTVVE